MHVRFHSVCLLREDLLKPHASATSTTVAGSRDGALCCCSGMRMAVGDFKRRRSCISCSHGCEMLSRLLRCSTVLYARYEQRAVHEGREGQRRGAWGLGTDGR
jgi:hypothetical protein